MYAHLQHMKTPEFVRYNTQHTLLLESAALKTHLTNSI
jgi:hypothetical protein